MAILKLASLALETPGSARMVGMKIAEKVNPEDTLDLENHFILFSNAFWDGFFRKFIELYGKEKVSTLKFINASDDIMHLIKYTIKKRCEEMRRANLDIEAIRKKYPRVSEIPL